MSLFSKRSLLVGIATFIIGLAAVAVIWGVPRFFNRSASVKSQVTAYLLDERGKVNGLLLASGDQLRFSPQTGEAVAARIKVGDEVTATGRPGTQSNYGREVRLQQLSANGRTIIEADGPRHPHEPHDRRGPKAAGERPAPPDAPATGEAGTEQKGSPGSDANANGTDNAQASPPETFKASGTIAAHLVNGHGEVDGLLLSSGEQLRFSPKAGSLVVAAEQGSQPTVNVEGTGVRGPQGTVIRPAMITVGSQTITLGR